MVEVSGSAVLRRTSASWAASLKGLSPACPSRHSEGPLHSSGDQDKSQGLLRTARPPHPPAPQLITGAVCFSPRLILDSRLSCLAAILSLFPNLSPASPGCADVDEAALPLALWGVPFTRAWKWHPGCCRNSEVASRSILRPESGRLFDQHLLSQAVLGVDLEWLPAGHPKLSSVHWCF